jgi:SAM-dependent methyltransferase
MQSVSDAIKSAGLASIPWIPPRSAVRSPSIGLRCPHCHDFLFAISYRSLARGNSSAYCSRCGTAFEQEQGIWKGLPESRRAHFAQFIEASELAGQEVAKGSGDPDFYLALPSRDLAQGHRRQWASRAKTFCLIQDEILSELAREGDPPLTILDLGAGTGWMSYRLARLGHQPLAIDVLTNSRNGLGAALHYRVELPEFFPRFQAEFDNLPFAGEQFDCAIFNASFHYSEKFDRTIAEAIRCLRPGGVLIVADSPTYSMEAGISLSQERARDRDLEELRLCTEWPASRECLTAQRLAALELRHEFEWSSHRCWYGFRWACRSWLANWRNKSELPEFVLYSAQVKTR